MQTNFTQEDLIRFIYQETSQEENVAILKALEKQYELREELSVLLETMQILNSIQYNPSDSVIKILNEEASSSSFEMS